MKLVDKQQTYNQFGDTLARAFEIVITPFIFGLLGWLVDRELGTSPMFALVLGILVFGYELWKLWFEYEQQMRQHERKLGLRSEADG